MHLHCEIDQAQGYLVARVKGNWDLDAVRQLIDTLAQACKERNCHKVLADCFEVRIEGHLLEFERFVVGNCIASRLRHIKIAALFPDHQINKFAESIAVEAGAEFLVSGDRDEALHWLTEEGSANGAGGYPF
jgi:hypothetical protein